MTEEWRERLRRWFWPEPEPMTDSRYRFLLVMLVVWLFLTGLWVYVGNVWFIVSGVVLELAWGMTAYRERQRRMR